MKIHLSKLTLLNVDLFVCFSWSQVCSGKVYTVTDSYTMVTILTPASKWSQCGVQSQGGRERPDWQSANQSSTVNGQVVQSQSTRCRERFAMARPETNIKTPQVVLLTGVQTA